MRGMHLLRRALPTGARRGRGPGLRSGGSTRWPCARRSSSRRRRRRQPPPTWSFLDPWTPSLLLMKKLLVVAAALIAVGLSTWAWTARGESAPPSAPEPTASAPILGADATHAASRDGVDAVATRRQPAETGDLQPNPDSPAALRVQVKFARDDLPAAGMSVYLRHLDTHDLGLGAGHRQRRPGAVRRPTTRELPGSARPLLGGRGQSRARSRGTTDPRDTRRELRCADRSSTWSANRSHGARVFSMRVTHHDYRAAARDDRRRRAVRAARCRTGDHADRLGGRLPALPPEAREHSRRRRGDRASDSRRGAGPPAGRRGDRPEWARGSARAGRDRGRRRLAQAPRRRARSEVSLRVRASLRPGVVPGAMRRRRQVRVGLRAHGNDPRHRPAASARKTPESRPRRSSCARRPTTTSP